eukprot:TRINITY_DN46_c5_g1_i1.p1 TRINITY_DN46_c5_g1~~TRINITY_DN46_c5_g1_i1.p1  ORF type:complete len:345 (+),score=68.44 TRINITY_DN46_c5_g1_i1:28-1062(+)
MSLFTINKKRRSITIFGVEYKATLDPNTNKYRKFAGKIYGTRAEIVFNSHQEFFEKIFERIPDEIKIENGAIESRVQTLENVVHTLNNKVEDLEESTNNRFNTVESKVETNTVSIDSLQSENQELRLLIQQLQEHNHLQDILIKNHESKIVSLEDRVSTLESENEVLKAEAKNRDIIIKKQNERITNVEQESVENLHRLKSTEDILNEDHEFLLKVANIFGIREDESTKLNHIQDVITQYNNRIGVQEILSQKNQTKIDMLNKRTEFATNENLKILSNRSKQNLENYSILLNKVSGLDNQVEDVKPKLEKITKNIKVMSNRSTENRELLKLKHNERQRRLNGNS